MTMKMKRYGRIIAIDSGGAVRLVVQISLKLSCRLYASIVQMAYLNDTNKLRTLPCGNGTPSIRLLAVVLSVSS